MNTPISSVGRVCLCELSGPVTVTMIVALLSNLKRVREAEDGPVLLLLHASAVSARSMALPTCSFLNGLPAILASYQEILIVTDDANVEPLRNATHCALASSPAQSAKQVRILKRYLGNPRRGVWGGDVASLTFARWADCRRCPRPRHSPSTE